MSNNPPAWLPPLIKLEDFENDPIKYMGHVYDVFKKDFIDSGFTFGGKPVTVDRRIVDDKEACFWHVTSAEDEQNKGQRNTDMRRCERIGWIKKIITSTHDPLVKIWESKRGRDKRTLIFLDIEHHWHLVVLVNTHKTYRLATAYCIDHESRRNYLLKESGNTV